MPDKRGTDNRGSTVFADLRKLLEQIDQFQQLIILDGISLFTK